MFFEERSIRCSIKLCRKKNSLDLNNKLNWQPENTACLLDGTKRHLLYTTVCLLF